MSKQQLDGNAISWTMDTQSSYTTNFGQVIIDNDTEELVECCVGFGRNQYNTQMQIKIYDGEFQISRCMFNTIFAELCSNSYPYSENCKQRIEVIDVLNMLQKDDNYSIAAILVKKTIVKLMFAKLKFGRQELLAIRELFKIWREAVVLQPDRHPIITRTPIIVRTPIIRR